MLALYGAIVSICALWVLKVTHRQPLSAGHMSSQWLAAHRARHFD